MTFRFDEARPQDRQGPKRGLREAVVVRVTDAVGQRRIVSHPPLYAPGLLCYLHLFPETSATRLSHTSNRDGKAA